MVTIELHSQCIFFIGISHGNIRISAQIYNHSPQSTPLLLRDFEEKHQIHEMYCNTIIPASHIYISNNKSDSTTNLTIPFW